MPAGFLNLDCVMPPEVLASWQRELVRAVATGNPARWPGSALAVHRGNIVGARVQALAHAFPVLRRIVGEACFDALARRHVQEVPARSADLESGHGEFPGWLRQQLRRQPALGALPYLGDLARLELHVNAAYYAADDTPADADSLRCAADAPHGWRLRLSRSLRLLSAPWPVDVIWLAHQAGTAPASVAAGRCRAVIWRDASVIQVESIDVETWRGLREIVRGHPLDCLVDSMPDPQWLSRCVRRGWILGASRRRAP